MRRERMAPRPDWRARVEARGLDWHTSEAGRPYWDESAFWRFDAEEIDRIEAATETLWSLCLHAIGHVVDGGELARFGYGPQACELIARSWRARDDEPSLYARFDLAYDGRDLKLLELNADTPTSLVEAAVVQWWWLQDRFPDLDQFNSIHEKLVSAFGRIAARARVAPCRRSAPDLRRSPRRGRGHDRLSRRLRRRGGPADPLRGPRPNRLARGAGAPGHFVDEADLPIRQLFKLVPWEWLLSDPFGELSPARSWPGGSG